MNIIIPEIDQVFTKDDLINLQACLDDAEHTTDRLFEREQKKTGAKRTRDKIYEDTLRGLIMEHFILQLNSTDVCKKATDLNPNDIYHDIVEVATGVIHECKTKETLKENMLEDYRVQSDIHKILNQGWNNSNYLHICDYINGMYIYKGFIMLREEAHPQEN